MPKKIVAGSAIVASAGLVASSFVLLPGAAFATTDCGVGTEVGDGVCELVYDTPGDFTFSVPSGVGKLAAVLVGAGGGALYSAQYSSSYGGGGGEVIYADTLPTSGDLAVTVGAGGAVLDGDPGQVRADSGGDTVVDTAVARGGLGGGWQDPVSGPDMGGESGNGNLGSLNDYYLFNTGAGGGAGGAAPDCYPGDDPSADCFGGMGLTASEVANDSVMFPALLGEPEYGVGGNGSIQVIPPSVGAYDAGHGGDAISTTAGDDGNDGIVILRWTYSALPDTGMNVQPWQWALGGVIVAAGAVLASGLLGLRRKGRHSA